MALFGATGGIGRELCRYILRLGGTLIMVDRNPCKAEELASFLAVEFPEAQLHRLTADLEDMAAVDAACCRLRELGVDVLIHNAGAYSISRKTCSTGLDNVFQINFASPYYVTRYLADHLAQRGGRVVVVGSIAHNYAKSDPADLDFSTRRKASLVYGNAKRYLMFSLMAWGQTYPAVSVAVTHPGITFTGITAHYPPWLFALIKHPMKWIFMPPRMAALSILQGVFTDTPSGTWIGPRLFGVWGRPRRTRLHTCPPEEQRAIALRAEDIYIRLQQQTADIHR